MLESVPLISIIKIDVEGAEKQVLNGLSGVINKVDKMIVEIHFDKDWEYIKNLLLNVYNFSCTNIISKEIVTVDSKRPYQCFCKKL